MISINILPAHSDKTVKKNEQTLFTAYYGNMPLVDIRAKTKQEAEDKFLFVLANGLRGKTIDFDLNKINDTEN